MGRPAQSQQSVRLPMRWSNPGQTLVKGTEAEAVGAGLRRICCDVMAVSAMAMAVTVISVTSISVMATSVMACGVARRRWCSHRPTTDTGGIIRL